MLLSDLAGTPVVPNFKASITFSDTGHASGNASCNRFTGAVSISGDSIKFGQLASTRMACVNTPLIFADGSEKPLRFSRLTTSQP